MNQGMNEVWGMDWGGVESVSMDGPPVGAYTFQLVSAKRDINKKGKPYVNVGCKVIRSDNEIHIGKVHWEYLSLESHRLGFTKAFFENVGAGACLVPGKGPGDAVGAVFEANVVSSTGANDQEYLNLRNIVAVDPMNYADDDEEETDDGGEANDGDPPEKSRPAPAKARVGGRR